MSAETKLLPCPFCGNEAVVSFGHDGNRSYQRIICLGDCGMQSERAYQQGGIEILIGNWNRRAEPEPAADVANLEVSALRMALSEMDDEMGVHLDRIRALETRLDALAERVATLEQVAGWGRGAGRGFREIRAAEPGEPSEG